MSLAVAYGIKRRGKKMSSGGLVKSSDALDQAADYQLRQEASPMAMQSPKVMVAKLMRTGASAESDIEADDYADMFENNPAQGGDNETMPIDHDMHNDDFLSDESDVDINERNRDGMLHRILRRTMSQRKGG